MPEFDASSNNLAPNSVQRTQDPELHLGLLRAEIQRGIDQLDCGEYIELRNEAEIDNFFADVMDRRRRRILG